jgi:hypothetical protein
MKIFNTEKMSTKQWFKFMKEYIECYKSGNYDRLIEKYKSIFREVEKTINYYRDEELMIRFENIDYLGDNFIKTKYSVDVIILTKEKVDKIKGLYQKWCETK